MDQLEVSRYLGQMTETRMKKRQEMVSPGVCVCVAGFDCPHLSYGFKCNLLGPWLVRVLLHGIVVKREAGVIRVALVRASDTLPCFMRLSSLSLDTAPPSLGIISRAVLFLFLFFQVILEMMPKPKGEA